MVNSLMRACTSVAHPAHWVCRVVRSQALAQSLPSQAALHHFFLRDSLALDECHGALLPCPPKPHHRPSRSITLMVAKIRQELYPVVRVEGAGESGLRLICCQAVVRQGDRGKSTQQLQNLKWSKASWKDRCFFGFLFSCFLYPTRGCETQDCTVACHETTCGSTFVAD